jgi:V-type H+-transporting ATPase subunit e
VRRLQHLLFSASVFCCWLMWAIIYMAQMNPLVNPVLAGVD